MKEGIDPMTVSISNLSRAPRNFADLGSGAYKTGGDSEHVRGIGRRQQRKGLPIPLMPGALGKADRISACPFL